MPPLARSPRRCAALLAGLALAFSTAAGAAPPAQPPDQLGPWAVGYEAFVLVDPAREDRSLATSLWFPVAPEDATGELAFYDFGVFGFGADSPVALAGVPAAAPPAGGFPLVVFSHGSGGINTQSTPLMETLASHGFVVVSPNHTGNTAVDFFFTSAVPIEQTLLDRGPDISFVIDEMLARNADAGSPLFGRVDSERIGVSGHSLGGFTSIATTTGYQGTPADARVRAIAPIAPFSIPYTDLELARISVPMLILGGSLDTTTPLVPHSSRPFEISLSRRRYRVDIEGATHTGFANVCEIGEALRDVGSPDSFIADTVPGWAETCDPAAPIPVGEVQRIQNVYVVSFFRRWLNGELDYNHFLSPEYAASSEPAVTYFLENLGCGSGFEFALVAPAIGLGLRGRRRQRAA